MPDLPTRDPFRVEVAEAEPCEPSKAAEGSPRANVSALRPAVAAPDPAGLAFDRARDLARKPQKSAISAGSHKDHYGKSAENAAWINGLRISVDAPRSHPGNFRRLRRALRTLAEVARCLSNWPPATHTGGAHGAAGRGPRQPAPIRGDRLESPVPPTADIEDDALYCDGAITWRELKRRRASAAKRLALAECAAAGWRTGWGDR